MHKANHKATQRTRIVVADDFPEMLDTVERYLAPDHEIVGRVADGLALVECVLRLQPDLMVIDVSMPKLNGIDALERLRSLGVRIPAIIFTNHDDEDLATRAFSAGSQGFVIKSQLDHDLRRAVADVLAGRVFVSKALGEKRVRKQEPAAPEGRAQLEPRPTEVLLHHGGLLIARAETADWKPGEIAGCWAKTLFIEQEYKIATSLIRMDPGTHFPPHRHSGTEEVFLLEGDLVVEGQTMKPGDYCRADAGSKHAESYSVSGCIFLLRASQLDEVFE